MILKLKKSKTLIFLIDVTGKEIYRKIFLNEIKIYWTICFASSPSSGNEYLLLCPKFYILFLPKNINFFTTFHMTTHGRTRRKSLPKPTLKTGSLSPVVLKQKSVSKCSYNEGHFPQKDVIAALYGHSGRQRQRGSKENGKSNTTWFNAHITMWMTAVKLSHKSIILEWHWNEKSF